MPARRTGQTGQIDYQGRSHEAADCGSFRLIRKVEPSKWLVEWTAACDATDAPRQSVIRFVSKPAYDRHF
jgi:hypothetical protein